MSNGDRASSVTQPRHVLKEIQAGHGEWSSVPGCVRETLLTILGSPLRNAQSEVSDHNTRVLLPLRRRGPKLDLSATLGALQETQRPLVRLLPNPQSLVTDDHEKVLQQQPHLNDTDESSVAEVPDPSTSWMRKDRSGNKKNNMKKKPVEEGLVGFDDCTIQEPVPLPDRRVYYSHVVEAPSDSSCRNRKTLHGRGCSKSRKKTPRVVCPIAIDAPVIKQVECVRHRHDVTSALIRVHDTINRLQEEVENSLAKDVHKAMRLDPRHTKILFGDIKPAALPTEEQEQALSAFSDGVTSLQKAAMELVSAFLTQEEKRFLGFNTHKYQTRTERSTTYQYTSSNITLTKGKNSEKRAIVAATVPSFADASGGKNTKNDQKDNVGQFKETARSRLHLEFDSAKASAPPPAAAAAVGDDDDDDDGPGEKERRKNLDSVGHGLEERSAPDLRHVSGSSPNSSVDLAPANANGGTLSGLLSKIENFSFKPAASQATPAVALAQGNKTEGGGNVTPSAQLKRKDSLSTLSVTSSFGGSQVKVKPELKSKVVEPAGTPAPAAEKKKTGGFERVDIKRFLIDSDTESWNHA